MDLVLHNEDLRKEILLRLPAKSLIRFKSVCKMWLSFISSDHFCRQHTLRCPKLRQFLILHDLFTDPHYFYWKPKSINGKNAMIPYTMKQSAFFDREHCKIVQECNGLLLLKGFDADSDLRRSNVYIVYNPTTRLWTKLKIPSYSDELPIFRDELQGIAIAFDPSESPYYKIVSVMCSSERDGDDHNHRVEVYDSESRSWKLSLGPFTLPPGFYKYLSACYYNSAIFWWGSGYNTYFCFDVAKNEMKEFSFPHSDIVGVARGSYLQELDGRLYYLRLGYGRVLELWKLGGDDKWILKDDHVFDSEEIGKCLRLMQGSYSDGSLQLIYYQPRKMKMRSYNFLHDSFEDLVDFAAPPFGYKYYQVYPYLLEAFQFGETLALV